MITAVIARDLEYEAVYASGYWFSASAYGLPDVGITTYTQMVDRVGTLVKTIGNAGVIADADTGYGGLLNVRETIRGYEAAGAQVIQIEDQEFPKKCGHTKNKRVIDTNDMVTKIKVALESRTQTDTLISARSDCYQGEGQLALMKRMEAFVKAGADIIFPEGITNDKEMREVCEAFDVPVMVNMADGGDTPILNAQELSDIGFAFAIFPAMTSLASAAASRLALTRLKETGTSINKDVELFDFSEFCKLIGFEDVWDFETRWLETK